MKNIFNVPQGPLAQCVHRVAENKTVAQLIPYFKRAQDDEEGSFYAYHIVEKAKEELDLLEAYCLMWDLYAHS